MEQETTLSPVARKWAWTLGSGLFTIFLAAVAALLPLIEWAPSGGLIGWLLFLAGTAEFAFGAKRGADALGKTAMVSGLLTALAGLVFITNPFADYFPVANVVMAWLFVRGAFVLAMALKVGSYRMGTWLALSGGTDIVLGTALAAGLSATALVASLFGPTREMVARFSLILAASFFATGISQAAVAFAERRKSPR